MQYTSDADDMAYKFTEPISKHFTSNEIDRFCETGTVSAVVVDRVLTPCPLSTTFSRCMTIAAAAAEIPGHPFGAAPYDVDEDSSIVSLLKHPNVLSSGSGSSYTVFVPTATALAEAGVTSPEFTATPGALDHVVSGHVIADELCAGTTPANGKFTTKLDGVADFCGAGGAVTVATGGQGAITVTSASGATAKISDTKNIAVCGGVAHVVDSVLLPCGVEAYSLTNSVPDAGTETPRGGVEVAETGGESASQDTPAGDVDAVADTAVSLAAGVLAAAVTLAAALAM